MSGIAAVCAIVLACSRHDASSVDVDAADLTGTFQCGTALCASGEICVQGESLGSGGSNHPDEHYSCALQPPNCSLAKCSISGSQSGEPKCPPCLVDLCQYGGFGGGFEDRTLYCGAPF